MKVIAKFECRAKDKTEYGTDLHFYAVTSGSQENDKFFASTPSGEVNIRTTFAVGDLFDVGQEYYLTFERA